MSVKARARRTPEDRGRRQPPKLRVFILEDQDAYVAGYQIMIERSPEKDLEFVGSHHENSEDLLDRIGNAKPDVVMVDLALGGKYVLPVHEILKRPLSSGIEAIRRIRERFGPPMRIVALSAYPELRVKALGAGVDQFCYKGMSFDQVREVIRGGAEATIGQLRGLEMLAGAEEYHFKVIGATGETPNLPLPPIQFVFLTYLAVERFRGTHRPLVRHGSLGYKPANVGLWHTLVQGCDAHSQGMHLQNHILHSPAVWRRLINKTAEEHLPPNTELVSGPGRMGTATYSLNPAIAAHRIVFTGFPETIRAEVGLA